jgi:hypothetical protein
VLRPIAIGHLPSRAGHLAQGRRHAASEDLDEPEGDRGGDDRAHPDRPAQAEADRRHHGADGDGDDDGDAELELDRADPVQRAVLHSGDPSE